MAPNFGLERAIECLWDCEAETRLIGIEHVDLSAEGVRARLAEMSADVIEQQDVREAASARLGRDSTA